MGSNRAACGCRRLGGNLMPRITVERASATRRDHKRRLLVSPEHCLVGSSVLVRVGNGDEVGSVPLALDHGHGTGAGDTEDLGTWGQVLQTSGYGTFDARLLLRHTSPMVISASIATNLSTTDVPAQRSLSPAERRAARKKATLPGDGRLPPSAPKPRMQAYPQTHSPERSME
jgi:hypothetical protein